LLLMLVVIIGWVAFRAHDMGNALTMYGAMFTPGSLRISDALAWQVTPDQWWCLLLAAVLVYLPLLGEHLPFQRAPQAMGAFWRYGWAAAPLAGFLLGMTLL